MIAGSYGKGMYILFYKKLPRCLPKWLYHFECPAAMNESPCCSTSSSAFCVSLLFLICHSLTLIEDRDEDLGFVYTGEEWDLGRIEYKKYGRKSL